MGRPRTKLHEALQAIAPDAEIYFQPKQNVELKYPCIIYKREDAEFRHANNELYDQFKKYQITIIDRDPDSGIPDEVAKLPMCSFNRFFTADGLNHDVYQVFF